MLISVVIPYYRAPALLERTLSAVTQALRLAADRVQGSPFEVLIVDDSADTAAASALDRIVAGNTHGIPVRVLRNHRNLGIAPSRNQGALQTTGEYLYFLDQDDLVQEEFFLHLLTVIEMRPDVVITNCSLFHDGVTKPYPKPRWLRLMGRLRHMGQLRPLFLLLSFNPFPSPGQFVISRHTFERAGGFPVLDHQGSDDFGLWLRLSDQQATLRCCFGSMFKYRMHNGNSRRQLDMRRSTREVLDSYFRQERNQRDSRLLALRLLSSAIPTLAKSVAGSILVRRYYSRP